MITARRVAATIYAFLLLAMCFSSEYLVYARPRHQYAGLWSPCVCVGPGRSTAAPWHRARASGINGCDPPLPCQQTTEQTSNVITTTRVETTLSLRPCRQGSTLGHMFPWSARTYSQLDPKWYCLAPAPLALADRHSVSLAAEPPPVARCPAMHVAAIWARAHGVS